MTTATDHNHRPGRNPMDTEHMTAAEYRAKAVKLLDPGHYVDPKPACVEQAAVWAQLAQSAAISEQKQEA